MSTQASFVCIYCSKECKKTDSRPYPSSKSADRIHNKCYVKKTLDDKKKVPGGKSCTDELETPRATRSFDTNLNQTVFDKVYSQECSIEKERRIKLLSKTIEDKQGQSTGQDGQFFFDIKAGIAKPQEKQRFLNHRNLNEIAARYDDQGFQDEAIGRAYDHSGKDLNTLGDPETDEEEETETTVKSVSRHPQTTHRNILVGKRKKGDLGESHHKLKKATIKLDEANPCWFCLSSPRVEKHLIVAIGEYCYLALAKGGLVDDHLLIVPIEHIESLNSSDNSKDLYAELEEFKKSLERYFALSSRGVIFYERNFRSVHWQLQVVPIPLDRIASADKSVKEVSEHLFSNSNYIDIPANCSLADMVPSGAAYIYWQIEPKGSRFVSQIHVKGSYFPVQLGRQVLADPQLLDCGAKVDWKSCIKSEDEYISLVTDMKKKYKEFDFT